MNFHVLTLFPEMIENGMNTSITGRAITKGLLTLEAVNIRDYAFNKHQKVDDYTYGGGAGMLMQAEPVYLAYEAIANRTAKRPRVVYLTPQGQFSIQSGSSPGTLVTVPCCQSSHQKSTPSSSIG